MESDGYRYSGMIFFIRLVSLVFWEGTFETKVNGDPYVRWSRLFGRTHGCVVWVYGGVLIDVEVLSQLLVMIRSVPYLSLSYFYNKEAKMFGLFFRVQVVYI